MSLGILLLLALGYGLKDRPSVGDAVGRPGEVMDPNLPPAPGQKPFIPGGTGTSSSSGKSFFGGTAF